MTQPSTGSEVSPNCRSWDRERPREGTGDLELPPRNGPGLDPSEENGLVPTLPVTLYPPGPVPETRKIELFDPRLSLILIPD